MECAKSKTILWFLFLVLCVEIVSAQEGCYGAGFVATSVVLSVLLTLMVVVAIYYWFKRRPKSEHLILETDPEKGKAEYAFDNPGFKDTTLLQQPLEKLPVKNETEKAGKLKWNNWTGISALNTKPEKRRAVDDSSLKDQEVKVVSLKSQDFAGLGFNICGNMKEGIFIKDILHRGPASESGKLSPGDRIHSITINFDHIVYEDALNILSFASPYEIIVEAKGRKILFGSSSKSDHPRHPLYRSSSNAHSLEAVEMAKKRLFVDPNGANLHKTLSNTTTLERKESKSPRHTHNQTLTFNPEQLKNQLEQKINSTETKIRLESEPLKINVEVQKKENTHQKFGVKVFPSNIQKSPKAAEISQNDNNINMEKNVHNTGLDEVDDAESNKTTGESLRPEGQFNRNDTLYGSGLKRDENGIPQEIPSHMLNAAVAARRNRKSQEETIFNEEDNKMLKKIKGKAPSPPIEIVSKESNHNLIQKETTCQKTQIPNYINPDPDSDEETDKHSSVTTIELNSCDITVHQVENDDKQNRKTASTGDLTKIHKTNKPTSGNLERAQSLDITDSGMPNLSKKTKGDTDIFDMNSDEEFDRVMLNKEPRLSLVLDGLNTFQRNRLKKSTEWGNLEDAILRSNRDEDSISSDCDHYQSLGNSSFKSEEKSAEFDAVVNKINEIRKESQEIQYVSMEESTEDIPLQNNQTYDSQKPKNQLWPTETEASIYIQKINPMTAREKAKVTTSPTENHKHKMNVQNEIWPKEIDEIRIKEQPLEKNGVGITSSIYKIETYETPKQSVFVNTEKESTDRGISELSETSDSRSKHYTLKPISSTIFPDDFTKESPEHLKNDDIMLEKSINSTDKDDVMIISESPPDAIEELEINENMPEEKIIETIPSQNKVTVTSAFKSAEITTDKTADNKMHSHRRQQIPVKENNVLLPPESNDSDMEKEMYSVINSKSSFTKMSDREAQFAIVEPSASCSNAGFLGFARNSETGEIFATTNNTDESKTSVDTTTSKYSNNTESFILNEKYSNPRDKSFDVSPEDSNSSENSEIPNYDNSKPMESIRYTENVSNVTINNDFTTNEISNMPNLELPMNDSLEDKMDSLLSESELYTTALNQSLKTSRETSKISISTPDLIKNVTITEAMNTLNGDMSQDESSEVKIKSKREPGIIINSTETTDALGKKTIIENSGPKHSSLTYITEIQVTPAEFQSNAPDIEIVQPSLAASKHGHISDSENNVRNYEIENVEDDGEIRIIEDSKRWNDSIPASQSDSGKESFEIQEVQREQLKKLPEMRFSTSSYENSIKNTEKRQSQVELLKSNFEKSPPKFSKSEITRSRIPISTTMKTPPTSPDHKESSFDADTDKESFEILPTTHSTPMVTTFKYQKPITTKNITITSIRSNSRIPSGLPVSGIRPPLPPKRTDQDNDSLSSTNSSISSFKQWVFNPVNSSNISPPRKQNQK